MKKLAVIGASYLQLPLVKKAREMGVQTHCFAWEKGAVCRDVADYFYPISTREKESILQQCQEIGIDGITTIASDTATITVNYVASHLGLISNPDEYSEICTNKYKMRQCFLENDIPSPMFRLVDKNNNYSITGIRFPLIIKPSDRSGSLGVKKISSLSQLDEAIRRAANVSFCHEVIIEEFVAGREISVEAISFQGQHYVLQITDKVTTGAPYYVEIEHHQPSTLSAEIQKKIRLLVPKALDALHVQNGASHSELIITPEADIRFIEIGARMGGDFIGSHLVQLSTGYDFLQGVIEVALGKFSEPSFPLSKYSGVYFLCKETEWLESVIKNSERYPEIVEAEITEKVLRRVECSDDRSGFAIYQANKKLELWKK